MLPTTSIVLIVRVLHNIHLLLVLSSTMCTLTHFRWCKSNAIVANRCVPTFVDLVEQAQDVFNVTSPSDIRNVLANDGMISNVTFQDLVLDVNIQDIIDGNL